jgi:ABC-type transporter MlaC component
MVKTYFICGAKDVRLFEICSNMKQRQKWFEAFETFCGKQIYGDKITDYSEICEQHFQQDYNYNPQKTTLM